MLFIFSGSVEYVSVENGAPSDDVMLGLIFGCRSACRLLVLPLPGSDVHVQAQHVVCGSRPGEGGDWDVFPGRHPLPVLLLALPHSLLPL